jgi:hypothetical protein
MIHCRLLKKNDDPLILTFINQSKDRSILAYHFPIYRDMLESLDIGTPLYFGAFVNEELVGYIPGFLKETEIGSAYTSLPFFGPNAGILYNKNARVPEEIHKTLLDTLLNYLNGLTEMLTASFYTPFLFKDYHFYEAALEKNFLFVEKFTQYLYLPEKKINSKIQYDIRKAQQSGLSVKKEITCENINQFYKIYLQNCKDNSIPEKPKHVIEFLLEEGFRSGTTKIYFAYRDNRMIGGLMVLVGAKTASYYLPCALSEEKTYQPITFLIDHAIQEASDDGIDYWNWESSPSADSGVFTFKKKWGSLYDNYRIYIKLFCSEEKIREIGKDKIMKFFPYHYIYPFNSI